MVYPQTPNTQLNRAYFQSSCNDNSEPIFKVFKWLMIECPFQINNPKRAYLFLYLLTNKILFLTQLIILFNLPAKGDSEPIFKVFKWFIIPKAHICFYICSQIKYYLKICIVFQLFISSIPIYVVHIYAT